MKTNFLLMNAMMLLLLALVSSCDSSEYFPQTHQSELLIGKGIPDVKIGLEEDFYFDGDQKDIYGPKTKEGWGEPVSLRGEEGPQGPQGPSGSSILSGTGVPENSNGRIGDYYLDKASGLLYGPKTTESWGIPANLKGPKGDKGDPGVANIIYSEWKLATSFKDSSIDASSMKVAYIGAPDLTSSRLENSAILVFFSYGGGVIPLPFTTYAAYKTSTISFIPMLGKICITRFAHDNNDVPVTTSFSKYRYVIIPGSTPAATVAGDRRININGTIYTKQQLQAMPYKQVATLLKMKN